MSDIDDWFGSAIEELVNSLGRHEEIGPDALATALSGLEAYLSARFRLSAGDRSEVASEAMTRFLERCRAGGVRAPDAAGLLTVMARNIAVDWIRRTTRETPTGEVAEVIDQRAVRDDEISAMLDRRADRVAIRDAIAELLALDDLATVRVVRVWLDLADEMGRAPSTREVGAAAGVSHTTVSRALRRFHEFVPDDRPETKTG